MNARDIDHAAFWAKCAPSPECWPWTAAKSKDGYGHFGVKGRPTGAHRVAWTLTNGPIPAGMNVLHRCDNPPCVRPDHLFLGTNADNSADMARKGRGRRGAGTMRERSPGSWEIRAATGKDPLTGKYRVVTKTFRGSRKQAQAALTALQAEADEGRYAGNGTATLGLLLDRWLELAAPQLSPRTVDGYRSNIDVHIKPWLGDVPVRKLCDEPVRLDNFYSMLKRPHTTSPTDPTPRQALKSATVGQVHAVIRRACRQGVIWRWIPTNPASLATPGSREAPEQHPPAPADALRLIAAAGGDLGVLLRLAAATGARRGELCALRWRHVDLEGGNVRIERALVESGGEVIDKTTKTKNQRTVSLDADTLDVLRAHRATWEARAAAVGATIGPGSWLFSFEADASEAMRPSSVTQAVRRLRDRLGLAGVRTHSLRHMHATQLLAARVPVKTVSARLGHTLVSTTLNIYAHSLDESDTEAAGIMGALLARPDEKETT